MRKGKPPGKSVQPPRKAAIPLAATTMSTTATLALIGTRIDPRCDTTSATLAAEPAVLQGWATRYLAATEASILADLIIIGREMMRWLAPLAGVLGSTTAPLILNIRVEKEDDSDLAKAFLDAPWEILADDRGKFLALRPDVVLCSIRRIGPVKTPPPAALHRLGLVFMAAAPRGADNLNFEAEEVAILTATENISLDFTVEESGTLVCPGAPDLAAGLLPLHGMSARQAGQHAASGSVC